MLRIMGNFISFLGALYLVFDISNNSLLEREHLKRMIPEHPHFYVLTWPHIRLQWECRYDQ